MMTWLQLADKATISIKGNETGLPGSTATISAGLTNIINILLGIIGGLAVIFIIIGGIQMITSAGEPLKYKQARETILYAVIGLVVALSAYAIVSFIAGKL